MTDVVRAGHESDLPSLLALAVAFYDEDDFTTTRDELRSNLATLVSSDAARVAVVEDASGRLVGFAITTTTFGLENGLIAELEDLYLEPIRRGGGLGDRLIGDSEEWARSRGASVLELVIAPNGHDISRLHAFYLDRGFTDDGRRLLSRRLG